MIRTINTDRTNKLQERNYQQNNEHEQMKLERNNERMKRIL